LQNWVQEIPPENLALRVQEIPPENLALRVQEIAPENLAVRVQEIAPENLAELGARNSARKSCNIARRNLDRMQEIQLKILQA